MGKNSTLRILRSRLIRRPSKCPRGAGGRGVEHGKRVSLEKRDEKRHDSNSMK